ncbi:BCCT family transporter [Yoonia sediminilitoris]|uniref:BCCT, betaine/carnitine/choline family transporter n=1 Tax=Yoonia sediminilitoris TaxID=1286148 RepID=A0A2T6K968_9RHOB|nr:BCCT family transporter [Yoonia sediminilitoris]PUB11309.1 BCCT, betaine/carnitine/choline family transporter [Yoonia sediminilitoris]RCW91125.1 BCCT, betaine/carnitine/choline family transporter [Yoonia sediminilitoris]
MAIKPPLMHLPIKTATSGFYKGFTKDVTITAKILVGALIVWAIAFPDQAASVLGTLNSIILATFSFWYVYVMAFFVILCFALALWPASGRLKMGMPEDEPEFSNFSWFSMMFGAGIGIGMLTFATAEPMYHWASNPETIQGLTEGSTEENVRAAYLWSFTHWGLAAWASYAIVGLSLGYFSYRRGLPLTIRTGLTPILGKTLSGPVGHVVDIVAVVATVLGVSQTLGFGVEQFISGLSRIGFGEWLYTADGEGGQSSSTMAIIFALLVIMGASTLSALSGVGKGIKWLSNINMGLSFFVLAFFIIFGSTLFGLKALGLGIFDYLASIPGNIFTVWTTSPIEGFTASVPAAVQALPAEDLTAIFDSASSPWGSLAAFSEGLPASAASLSADDIAATYAVVTENRLSGWQGAWTIFYWAWWIAFAPFVGVFLARISRGRTVREYVLGAMIIPALMCFVWFALVGGTAIDLELTGTADGAISGAGQEAQLFAMLDVILSPALAWGMSVLIVVLLLTYLVTSADSAVLIINTINAAGDEGPKARPHILFWGAALALVVGGLIIAGGLGAIQTAMVIGALPFSLVMVLMGLALIKGIYLDGRRQAAGVPSTIDDVDAQPAE